VDNVKRCGTPTKNGKACRQVVNLLPCRYHNAAGFDAMVIAINNGQLGLCPDCHCWYPATDRHSCVVSTIRAQA
jgi:hypothetical protein